MEENNEVGFEFKERRETHNDLVSNAIDRQRRVLDIARTNLPRLFKKRAKQLAKECEQFNIQVSEGVMVDCNEKLLNLCEHAFMPIINTNGTMMSYNYNEIAVGFDYYRKIVLKLNENGSFYMPTKEDFCRLMGISTSTLLSYKTSNSIEMREICLMIDDYLASMYTQAGLVKKIEPITGMFYQKSALGRKETSVEQAPQQVTNNIVVGDSELKEMLRKLM